MKVWAEHHGVKVFFKQWVDDTSVWKITHDEGVLEVHEISPISNTIKAKVKSNVIISFY